MPVLESKLMKISELPESYPKEQLKKLVTNPAVADVYVVMKEGGANDWSAYIGFPKLDDCNPAFRERNDLLYYTTCVREPLDVASNGDKLDETIARLIFPDIKLEYRR